MCARARVCVCECARARACACVRVQTQEPSHTHGTRRRPFLTATRLPAVPRALCSPLTAPRASLPLASQAYGTTPGAFNRLVLHEELILAAAQLLGTSDVRLTAACMRSDGHAHDSFIGPTSLVPGFLGVEFAKTSHILKQTARRA